MASPLALRVFKFLPISILNRVINLTNETDNGTDIQCMPRGGGNSTQNLTETSEWWGIVGPPSNPAYPLAQSGLAKGEVDLLPGSFISLVNNNTLQNIWSPAVYNAPFPYGRLASILAADSTFIYHQINASTLVEEILDVSLNSLGRHTAINIPTS
ncbi:hypothetical protein MMC10_008131 [Thelotrema lepadinum]|nr:hypothetical protein [Thelotrema lepadinum]